ncbi:MAG: glycosyltransferase family 4 protein, partial [Lachnospiraceae bacterium]|nr:glycosyltransferase family 4 protein [Lachnospiraceae bacterium]
YNFFKQKNMSKDEARKLLGLREDEKVLLFFGLVRDYKGLKHLLKAVEILKKRDEAFLLNFKVLIVGDFAGSRDKYDKMIEEYGIGQYLSITDEFLQIPEVEKYFAASDMVVLPYESATQSGVIQIAYSFEKPVIATRVGGLPDVVIDCVTGYLVNPLKPKEIADSIVDYYKNNRYEKFREGIKKEAYRYSWDRMEEVINSLTAFGIEEVKEDTTE